MTVTVESATPLSRDEERNIKRIMRDSNCPNESLAASFPRYHALDNFKQAILFDEGERNIVTKIIY